MMVAATVMTAWAGMVLEFHWRKCAAAGLTWTRGPRDD